MQKIYCLCHRVKPGQEATHCLTLSKFCSLIVACAVTQADKEVTGEKEDGQRDFWTVLYGLACFYWCLAMNVLAFSAIGAMLEAVKSEQDAYHKDMGCI